MTMSLATVAVAAVVLLVPMLAAVLALALPARPWELRGGSWMDRLRVVDALNSYDFWLGLRGVSGRRRRELRDELRANLWDATLRVGSKQAVRAIGSTRRLAAESADGPAGPRWGRGLFAGFLALELVVALELLAMTVWADAAEAAKVSRLEGSITLIPGMRATFEQSAGGFSVATDLGPIALVVGVLTFLAVSRPWRLFAPAGSGGGRPLV